MQQTSCSAKESRKLNTRKNKPEILGINLKKMEDIEKLIEWFYKTDAKLDESDLDAFHDKSVVTAEAEKFLPALNQKREEEIKNAVDEIHAELHNGRIEPAYKLTCNLLALLKGGEK